MREAVVKSVALFLDGLAEFLRMLSVCEIESYVRSPIRMRLLKKMNKL